MTSCNNITMCSKSRLPQLGTLRCCQYCPTASDGCLSPKSKLGLSPLGWGRKASSLAERPSSSQFWRLHA